MRSGSRIATWAAVVIGMLCANSFAADANSFAADANSFAADVGDNAPAFRLPGSDGQVHALSDYGGRFVVLAFFPKAFTGG